MSSGLGLGLGDHTALGVCNITQNCYIGSAMKATMSLAWKTNRT